MVGCVLMLGVFSGAGTPQWFGVEMIGIYMVGEQSIFIFYWRVILPNPPPTLWNSQKHHLLHKKNTTKNRRSQDPKNLPSFSPVEHQPFNPLGCRPSARGPRFPAARRDQCLPAARELPVVPCAATGDSVGKKLDTRNEDTTGHTKVVMFRSF